MMYLSTPMCGEFFSEHVYMYSRWMIDLTSRLTA